MLLRFSPSFNKIIAKKVIMMLKIVITPVSIYPIRPAYFINLNELRSYCEHACCSFVLNILMFAQFFCSCTFSILANRTPFSFLLLWFQHFNIWLFVLFIRVLMLTNVTLLWVCCSFVFRISIFIHLFCGLSRFNVGLEQR